MGGRKRSGPRTELGRAAVRLNPLKHGVLSQTPVIPLVEREEDWERLRKGIHEYYDVQGMMEEALADIIAGTIWRRHRAVRFETESITAYLDDVPEDYRRMRAGQSPEQATDPDALGREAVAEMDRMLTSRLLPGAETLDKVMRYETKLHRFLMETIHQLLVLQALREGRQPPIAPSGGRQARPRKLRPTETETGGLVGLTAKRASLVGLGALREPPATAGRQDEREGGDDEGEARAEREAEGAGVLRGWDASSHRGNRAERRRRERRNRPSRASG